MSEPTKIMTECCGKLRKTERTEIVFTVGRKVENGLVVPFVENKRLVCKEGMGCKTPRPVGKESVDQSAADDHLDYLSDQW